MGDLTRNFSLAEFRCHDGTGVPSIYLPNVTYLATNLQVLRDELGQKIKVRSGYRTPSYNASINGARNSQHKLAKAADIVSLSKTPSELHDLIEELIAAGKMSQGGLGLYKTFVHYDVRGTRARWEGHGGS
jgi:uncharacterized protein YcbK (DUF882 family)